MTMTCDFEQVELSEVAKLYDSLHQTPQYSNEGYPMVRVTDIRRGYIDTTNAVKVDEQTYSQFSNMHRPKVGDILFSRVGSYGNSAYVNRDEKFCLGQNTVCISPERARIEPAFLYCVLNSDGLRHQIESLVGGASQGTISLKSIRKLQVPLPPLPVQKRIAGILSAYDDLIENSQCRIGILNAMAGALYRETLQSHAGAVATKPIVDCAYWRFISENVGKYTDTKRYYATADVDALAITGPGIEYSFSEKPSRAQKQPIPHSVWFARMKDTYKIAWYGAANARQAADSILSSGFAGFEARDPDLWPLLFLTISSTEFHTQKNLYCTGATQMSLTNEGLGRIEMPIPGVEAARRLGDTVGPLINLMLTLQQRNENLRRTRDLLLPRLLSGLVELRAA